MSNFIKKTILIFVVLSVSFSLIGAKDRPTVAVVLSGGGAKGIAHIALLEKLEELGIPVDMVLGTSMGSLIGGLYSAGYSPHDIRKLVSDNDLSQLFNVLESKGYKSLIEPFEYKSEALTIGLGKGVLSVSGILDDYKIMNFFYDSIGNLPDSIDFDDLPIPFRCIGTNAITGEAKIFEDGNLITAMRASMSIPFAFSPTEIDGQLYVDGGLVDNMPIALAKSLGYDIIIAEDVNAKIEVTTDLYSSISGAVGALFRVIVNTTISDQLQYADLILKPDVKDLGIFSFGEAEKIIERGEIEVEERIDELKAIADMFTEDQKEYKDPSRVGDYFTLFEKRIHKKEAASKTLSTEKAYAQTRISTRLKLSSNLRHDFIDNYPYEFLISSGFETKLFVKELKGSRFSFQSKVQIGYQTSFDNTLLYELYSGKNNLFAFANNCISLGSISQATDKNSYRVSIASTFIETSAETKLGLQLTDESTHNMNLYGGVLVNLSKSLVSIGDFTSKPFGPRFFATVYPHIAGSYVWYGESGNSNFYVQGARFDFLTRAGFIGKEFIYKLGCAFEFTVPVSEKGGVFFDSTAFTTREPDEFASSYINYGGWLGMPGLSFNEKYRDYIYGGIGYQLELGQGLITEYLMFEVRAGYREECSAYTDICLYGRDNRPFYYMIKHGKFDLGVGVGVGFESFLGEAIVGVGITKDKNFALYINVV